MSSNFVRTEMRRRARLACASMGECVFQDTYICLLAVLQFLQRVGSAAVESQTLPPRVCRTQDNRCLNQPQRLNPISIHHNLSCWLTSGSSSLIGWTLKLSCLFAWCASAILLALLLRITIIHSLICYARNLRPARRSTSIYTNPGAFGCTRFGVWSARSAWRHTPSVLIKWTLNNSDSGQRGRTEWNTQY